MSKAKANQAKKLNVEPELEPEPEVEYSSSLAPVLNLIDYDSCVEILSLATQRIADLTEEETDLSEDELAIRLVTINNLDSILILHGLQRHSEEEEEETDDDQEEEQEEDER